MTKIPQVLNDFAGYKITLQNRSPKTVDQYCTDMVLFLRFLIAEKNGIPADSPEFNKIDISSVDIDFVCSVTKEDVFKFLLYTANVRGNAPRARARKLSSIKSFYNYICTFKEYTKDNPAADVKAPAIKNGLPKFLSLEESIGLLNSVKNDKKNPQRLRDFCILTLFLNCGMRLAELTAIKTTDLDKNLHTVRVLGKGRKERMIYLNSACKAALTDYLEYRKSIPCKSGNNALFFTRSHTPISERAVQNVVYKYLDVAGLGHKHYSTHKLRHTAATLMYQNGGVDVRVLKEILGHEQLNTTQIYTHVSDNQIEQAMEKNPLVLQGAQFDE